MMPLMFVLILESPWCSNIIFLNSYALIYYSLLNPIVMKATLKLEDKKKEWSSSYSIANSFVIVLVFIKQCLRYFALFLPKLFVVLKLKPSYLCSLVKSTDVTKGTLLDSVVAIILDFLFWNNTGKNILILSSKFFQACTVNWKATQSRLIGG